MCRHQQSFEKLVTSSLDGKCFDDLKDVALAVWHEGFVPSLENLSPRSYREAGYVLDNLRRFNCVPLDKKEELSKAIELLENSATADQVRTTHASVQQVMAKRTRDRLARKWGLDTSLNSLVQELLPYQTRHYDHTASAL
ncbi:hypothetical protein DN730_18205 [Marinomonas piezotolerans]|uniref:Uncharacterized protein n=1 Tax=Marinomonas piezotolerans TaxID=2213058 RepID=A0A370U4R6_9GAMM|nr:hypothetical protein [Marinomonas piezotolerans]RDL42753.1 hypothetical protein DN730_18205 [Marinomonas piezotolerans]